MHGCDRVTLSEVVYRGKEKAEAVFLSHRNTRVPPFLPSAIEFWKTRGAVQIQTAPIQGRQLAVVQVQHL